MSKDSYNIDDILSEVKKRKEEQTKAAEKETEQPSEPQAEPAPEETEDVIPAVEEEPVEETMPEQIPDEKDAADTPDNDGEVDEENTAPPAEDSSEQSEQKPVEEDADGEMVDLNELASKDAEETEPEEKTEQVEKKKKHKKLKVIIAVLAVLIVAAAAVGVVYANGLIDEILGNNSSAYTDDENEEPWQGMSGDAESFEPIMETEATELSSLQDMIKVWFYNGKPCSSSKVLNVLLIGEDTRGSEILDDGTRADAAIIASINSETKTITLTSILRDTYAYFESTPGNKETGQFGKINGAMSIGNIHTYISCVENLYKINIDNYVIVNFDSFETIVDTLGGVELEITDKEINEINNHQKRYNKTTITKTYSGTSGVMKLNGKQALAYCRIRKLDSDNKRADRQKTCLIKLFEEASNAPTSKLLKLVKNMIPYVSTGFGKSDIIKIAKYAITENWLGYKTQTTNLPDYRIKERGAGGIHYGAWCWKSDFPMDAYYLQSIIYGKSSITLARSRVDVIKCAETGFRELGAAPVSATLTNYNYGEVTSCEITTESKKEKTTTAN